MPHVLSWFDIPVRHFNRAQIFYETILQVKISPMESCRALPGAVLGIFPHDPQTEIGGALVEAPGDEPSRHGAIVYLNANPDLGLILSRVEAAGGKILMPKTFLKEEAGFIAFIEDSEGNRIGLHSMD